MIRRTFERNMPPMQAVWQGPMAKGNALSKVLAAERSIQPGNTFHHQLRITILPSISGPRNMPSQVPAPVRPAGPISAAEEIKLNGPVGSPVPLCLPTGSWPTGPGVSK